jgi:hypothetical protein
LLRGRGGPQELVGYLANIELIRRGEQLGAEWQVEPLSFDRRDQNAFERTKERFDKIRIYNITSAGRTRFSPDSPRASPTHMTGVQARMHAR